MERVLICGDRDWTDRAVIAHEVEGLIEGAVVIHGAARGADSIAGEAAKARGLQVEEYPADWARYGKGAGPIRNAQMLEEGKPDRVIAFHRNLPESRGTLDMVRRARKAGLVVRVVAG